MRRCFKPVAALSRTAWKPGFGLAGAVVWGLLAVSPVYAQTSVGKTLNTAAADASGPESPVATPKLPVPVIMMVDPETVLQESNAGQAVRKAHDHYLRIFQDKLEAGRRALAARQTQIAGEKSALSAQAWQKKANAFDLEIVKFNRKFQKASMAVEKSYRTAMGELGRAFARVATEVANREGANLVLPVQQVILHDRRMDMTAEVIARMNKEFPSVKFPAPTIDGRPASEYVAIPKFGKK